LNNHNFNHIKFSEEDRIAVIKIDSPPANQLNLECFNEIQRAVYEIQWKKSADVLILTGNEKFFGSGLDLKSIDKEIVTSVGIASRNAITAIETLEIPTIAVINGFALGGGMELALATDIRISSDKAKFGQPEVKLGIIPGAGGTQRLTHLIGSAKASEMILTGDIITAEQALSWGIISKVVPHDQLMETGLSMAKRIQKNAPLAIKKAKSSIKIASRVKDLETGLDFETTAFNEVFNTEDRIEGIQAFLEKRTPDFKGK
jgi:enoyl-CoA hydratase